MKHELDDNSEVRLTPDGEPVTDENLRYYFFEGLKQHLENRYKTQRLSEYPPIGDQLDALWKGGEAAEEMLATIQAVKSKYPKPE